jgi:hypothetical protein
MPLVDLGPSENESNLIDLGESPDTQYDQMEVSKTASSVYDSHINDGIPLDMAEYEQKMLRYRDMSGFEPGQIDKPSNTARETFSPPPLTRENTAQNKANLVEQAFKKVPAWARITAMTAVKLDPFNFHRFVVEKLAPSMFTGITDENGRELIITPQDVYAGLDQYQYNLSFADPEKYVAITANAGKVVSEFSVLPIKSATIPATAVKFGLQSGLQAPIGEEQKLTMGDFLKNRAKESAISGATGIFVGASGKYIPNPFVRIPTVTGAFVGLAGIESGGDVNSMIESGITVLGFEAVGLAQRGRTREAVQKAVEFNPTLKQVDSAELAGRIEDFSKMMTPGEKQPTDDFSMMMTPVIPENIEIPPPRPESTAILDVKLHPEVEFPVDKIILSKDVPNFKEMADVKTGVVAGERLEGQFRRYPGQGAIVVWERNNGDFEVITGRHRLDLARRTGEKTIPTQIVKESEGFTKEMALVIDAESNIMEGQGSVKDYAHYFRNVEITAEEAAKRGLLSRAKGNNGFIIAKGAGNDLYAGYIGGQVPEAKAVAIAKAAPNNERVQAVALKKAEGGMTAEQLDIFCRILMRTKPSDKVKAKQGQLFAFDDSALIEAEKVASEVAKEVKSINARISSVKGALKRPEIAKKMGLSFSDEASINAEVERLKVRLDQLDRVDTTPELYQEMRERAGLGGESLNIAESLAETVVERKKTPTITDEEYEAIKAKRRAQRETEAKVEVEDPEAAKRQYETDFRILELEDQMNDINNRAMEEQVGPAEMKQLKKKYAALKKERDELQLFGSKEVKPKKSGESNVIVTKDRYEQIRENLRKRMSGGTLSSGIDPKLFSELVEVGVYHFERKVRDYAAWSKAQYLPKIWDEVQKLMEESVPARQKAREVEAEIPDLDLDLQPIRSTSGEMRVRGLSQSVADYAKTLGLDIGRLPEYEVMKIQEQMDYANNIKNSDPEYLADIAMGRRPAPAGLTPEAAYVTMANSNDINVETARELAYSARTEESTTMGQRIRVLAELKRESAVSLIRDVSVTKETEYERKTGNNLKSEKKAGVKEVKESVRKSSSNKKDWQDFIRSLEC